MRQFHKKLAVAGATAALMATVGLAFAQSTNNDPNDTPQTAADAEHGSHLYFFKDQGTSPETDPAAHLLLIKHQAPVQPVALQQTTTTTESTTVADATPPAPVDNTPAAAPADTSSSNTSTDTSAPAPSTDTPALAPRADRN